ncbi:hypothetical protein SscP1EGY_40 [Streptomyces phage SscP1EGY]|nr:hypothetical protein SscP1EGY_40 [Streptomyces phage SscP1EGY]
MPRPVVKVTFFALLVAFILWIIARVREEITTDPFDTEN